MKKTLMLLIILSGISYSSMSQEMLPVWIKTLGGVGWDMANTLCTNTNDDIIVAGSFRDSIDIEGKRFYSNGCSDAYVSSYTSNGEFIDAYTIGGEGDEFSIFSEYNNYHILLLKYYAPFEYSNVAIDTSGYINYMISWLDDNGTLVAKETIACSNTMEITGMEVDKKGNIFLVGYYNGKLKTIENELTSSQNCGFIYTTSLKNKKPNLVKLELDDPRCSEFNCCRLIGNQLYIVGILTESTKSRVKENTLFSVIYNTNKRLTDFTSYLYGKNLTPVSVIDINNDILISSKYKMYCVNGEDTIRAIGLYDVLMTKIRTKKKESPEYWSFGSYGNDKPFNFSSSGDQIILTGEFTGTVNYCDDYLIGKKKGTDIFLSVYGESNAPLKNVTLGGIYNDFPCKVVTADAGVFVFGQFKKELTLDETKYETQGSYDVFIARFENCGAKQSIEITAETSTDSRGDNEYVLTIPDNYASCEWSNSLGYGNEVSTSKAKNYTVYAIDEFGCECTGSIDLSGLKSSTVNSNGVTTISNADQAEFMVYPTYTSNIVYWQPGSNYPKTGASLEIVSMDGKTVFTHTYGSNIGALDVQTLHLSGLTPGVYLIQVTGIGYSKSSKVIVK